MARPQRIDFDGAIHHVMNRGVNHEPIFFGDPDRIEFGRRLADIHERFGVTTLAYCLMGNHYHLLLRTPAGDLSSAMHRLASLYSRHTNDRVGRDGPLFRSRFHSILVTTDSYLLTATRYIHRNSLDMPGVRSIDGYRWSSYRSYVGARRTPTFVQTDLVLGCFSHDRSAFAEFHADRSTTRTVCSPADADDVMQIVEFVITEDQLFHEGETSPAPRLERTVALLLVNDHPGAAWHRELEARCAFTSSASRRMALHRARQRRAADPTVARIATKVESLLA